MKNVEAFFENYPKEKMCFNTSDGFVFIRKDDAGSHASTLKDKEVKAYTREEVLMSEKAPEVNPIGDEAPVVGDASKSTTKTDKK